MRSLAPLWPVLLFACVGRPLGDPGASDGSTEATATPPATASDTTPATTANPTTSGAEATTSGPVTSGPVTSEPVTSGPVTSEPVTSGATTSEPVTSSTTGFDTTTDPVATGPSSTVTTDVSTTDATVDPEVMFDFPPHDPLPAGLVGCALAAPPGTAVAGRTGLGPFVGDRAYFGGHYFKGANIPGKVLRRPRLLFISPGTDAQVALDNTSLVDEATFTSSVSTEFYANWPGTWSSLSFINKDDQFEELAVEFVITELAGNWDAADPADPPRLIGSLSGAVTGPFDAVHCDLLDIHVLVD